LGALALSPERQSARMSKTKNGGLDQYGAEPFEQQQFGTAGVEGVKTAVDDFGHFPPGSRVPCDRRRGYIPPRVQPG